ncbi:MAG: aldehyde dehydrogenase family protein [Neisseriaceae bacterium]|nr:aldehyde dehydrogenase family protein [Neisseriaceae bacterium]MBP6862819.1 aldehyde dehydrogenase family protein [Neisseriaceae bacterium]
MTYISTNPYTETVIYRRAADDVATFSQTLSDLQQAQPQFAALPIEERMARLSALAKRIEANKQTLATLISEEVGRCLRECLAEVDKSIELIRYYAKLAPELLAHQTIATQASLSQVRFEPLGVVLAVMPWNYPVWQILRFAIPALCAGNACVVKPAPSVGRVTEALFALVEADLPFKAAFLAHEDVPQAIAATDALAFTGSSETGRYLAGLAGQHLKKCVLELGGSNAVIVLPDADLQLAAVEACYSRYRDAGQSCNAAKRLIVADSVVDEFLVYFQEAAAKLVMGDPLSDSTSLAPLHTEAVRQRLHGQVKDALDKGAILLRGGYIPPGKGYFYPATIIDQVNQDCRVYDEEVFGPVISLLRAQDAEEAIRLANDTPFGLGASIYSQNEAEAWDLAKRLQVGSVFMNRHTSSDLRLPFGGVKSSGFGRELSEFGLYEFVNVKTYWQK